MTDTERKEVEELTKALQESISKENSTWNSFEVVAKRLVAKGYTKRPQANNTTCPSREEFAKELFNSLGGCVIKETTGHTIYDRWVCAKFGKDNSGMVANDEMALREFLWLNHGHTGQYGDDGEMQCQMCCHYQCTDYKREPLSKVINSSIKARFDVNIAKRHCRGSWARVF